MSEHRIVIKINYENKCKYYKARLNDSIKDIKIKIQDNEGFPFKFQKLFFKNQLLENNKTLYDYGIKNKTNLDLTLEPYEKILIFIQLILGQKIIFSLSKNTKIEKLKYKIQKKELINEKFILKYNNILLEDGKTLEDYKITNNSIIYLYLDGFFEFSKIYANYSNRNICLNIINGSSKIKDIKKKLSKIINIPYSELVLYLDDMILDDNEIVNLDIDKDYTFKLFIKTKTNFIKSYNENNTKDNIDDIDSHDNGFANLRKLKELIERRYHSVQRLGLLKNDNKKLNDEKTLYDYSITKNISNGGMNIFLKGPSCTYTIMAELSDTVKEFKKRIIQEKNIFINNLLYAGNILKDEFILANYNVHNNSTIFLI